jgi:hypothetical protein
VTTKPLLKSEKVATVEEVTDAIEKLHPEDWAKLAAFSKNRAQYMRLYGAAIDDSELMRLAIVDLLETRRTWKAKNVTFANVVIGVMRSIASNHKAKSSRNGYSVANSQLAGGEGDDEDRIYTPLDSVADPRLNVELQMVAVEVETAREAKTSTFVAGLYEFFEADAEAQLVMNGWLEGKSGPDIMVDLGIDRTAFETIAKRIRRKSTARWPKGSTHVIQ